MTDIEETPVVAAETAAPAESLTVDAAVEPTAETELIAPEPEPAIIDAPPDHGPASLHIEKNGAGEWEVVSTFADGQVTTTAWALLRHALLNAEPWVRAHQ